MHCSKCKAEIDDYDVNCPFCGQKTSELYVRDVSELRKKIEENNPPITYSKIIQDLLCDRKDDSAGTRIAFIFFSAISIAIFIVIWSLVQPLSWFNFSDSLGKLFDSFWSLFGLTPEHYLVNHGRRGGDIRGFITILIVAPIIIRYIAGKDRSGENKK